MSEGQRFVCRASMQPTQGRTARLVISTADVDSFDTRFAPDGCRLQRYLAAPIVLWHHAGEAEGIPDPDCGIGVSTSVTRAQGQLVADIALEEGNPIADKVLRKIRNGSLFGCSIGALILRAHQEGDVTVVDEWELCEISLCFVPSNAAALIVRSAARAALPQRVNNAPGRARPLQTRRLMETAELLKALGLEDGATFDAACKALLDKLADDDQKKAMVAAVMAMKPAEGGQASEGDAVARAAECAPDVEKQALRNALTAKDRELAALKSKLGPTPDSDPKTWAKTMVQRGLKHFTEAELAEMAEKTPEVAQRTAELLLGEKGKLGLHTRSLGTASNAGTTQAGAAGPRLGADPKAQSASFDERRKQAESRRR